MQNMGEKADRNERKVFEIKNKEKKSKTKTNRSPKGNIIYMVSDTLALLKHF